MLLLILSLGLHQLHVIVVEGALIYVGLCIIIVIIGLEEVVGAGARHAGQGVVGEGPVGLGALEDKAFLDVCGVLVGEVSVLEGDPPENHVVLCEGACFVCEEELDAAEFFGDGGVTRNCVLDVGVDVDAVGVDEFGEVEVDAHGDGDDRAEQDDVTVELHQHVPVQR